MLDKPWEERVGKGSMKQNVLGSWAPQVEAHGGNGLNLTGSTQMYYSEAERAKVGHHFDQ